MKSLKLLILTFAFSLVLLCSCSQNVVQQEKSENKGSTDEVLALLQQQGIDIDKSSGENSSKGRFSFTNYEDLVLKFLEALDSQDPQLVRDLYYDNILGKLEEKNLPNKTQQERDAALKESMSLIYNYFCYPYGSAELPKTQSPFIFVNDLYNRSYGEPIGLSESQVTDCVDLEVYKTTGATVHHMLACIDDYWYFVV